MKNEPNMNCPICGEGAVIVECHSMYGDNVSQSGQYDVVHGTIPSIYTTTVKCTACGELDKTNYSIKYQASIPCFFFLPFKGEAEEIVKWLLAAPPGTIVSDATFRHHMSILAELQKDDTSPIYVPKAPSIQKHRLVQFVCNSLDRDTWEVESILNGLALLYGQIYHVYNSPENDFGEKGPGVTTWSNQEHHRKYLAFGRSELERMIGVWKTTISPVEDVSTEI